VHIPANLVEDLRWPQIVLLRMRCYCSGEMGIANFWLCFIDRKIEFLWIGTQLVLSSSLSALCSFYFALSYCKVSLLWRKKKGKKTSFIIKIFCLSALLK
jgi:hypothetical protein